MNFIEFCMSVAAGVWGLVAETWGWWGGAPLAIKILVGLPIFIIAWKTFWGKISNSLSRLIVLAKAEKINAGEALARNWISKIFTYLGLAWMVLAILFAIWIFQYFDGERGLLISGGLFGLAAVFSLFITWLSGPLLTMSDDIKELGEDEPVRKAVAAFCERAMIKPPRVYICDDSTPNAFFCGLGAGRLVLHRGFLKGRRYTNDEIHAVLAHELGHRLNGDILLTTFTITIVIAIQWIGKAMVRAGQFFMYGFGGDDDDDDDNDSNGNNILLAIGLIVAGFLVSTVLTGITILAKLAVSRQREFMADRMGIALTGNPQAFASLFKKLEHAPRSEASSSLQAALYINEGRGNQRRGPTQLRR